MIFSLCLAYLIKKSARFVSGIFEKTVSVAVARLYESVKKLNNSNFKNDDEFAYIYTWHIALLKTLMCVRSVK